MLQDARSQRTKNVRWYSDCDIAQCGPHSSKRINHSNTGSIWFYQRSFRAYSTWSKAHHRGRGIKKWSDALCGSRSWRGQISPPPLQNLHSFLLIHHHWHWKRPIMYTATSAARSTWYHIRCWPAWRTAGSSDSNGLITTQLTSGLRHKTDPDLDQPIRKQDFLSLLYRVVAMKLSHLTPARIYSFYPIPILSGLIGTAGL